MLEWCFGMFPSSTPWDVRVEFMLSGASYIVARLLAHRLGCRTSYSMENQLSWYCPREAPSEMRPETAGQAACIAYRKNALSVKYPRITISRSGCAIPRGSHETSQMHATAMSHCGRVTVINAGDLKTIGSSAHLTSPLFRSSEP